MTSLRPENGGDGTDGFFVTEHDGFGGRSVGGAGDVNRDGLADIIVGGVGLESYVVFGRAGGVGAQFELTDLLAANGGDGSAGFALISNPSYGSDLISASGAGDVNGDGIDDVLIGAWYYDQCFVVFGRESGFPPEIQLSRLLANGGGDGSKGFVVTGPWDSELGHSVSDAGDVNADGVADIIVGEIDAFHEPADAFVILGRTSGFPEEIDVESLYSDEGGDGSVGFVMGAQAYSGLGFVVSSAGDVNGDGVDDLIVGARYDGAFVVFGRPHGFPAELDLMDLLAANGGDGSAGFFLQYENGDYSGRIVSTAGDVNGDGIDDVLISGDYPADDTYVVFGRTTGFPAEIDLAVLLNGGDESQGYALLGKWAALPGNAGDFNDDGIDDILIGGGGEVFAVFGRAVGAPDQSLSHLYAANGGDGSEGVVLLDAPPESFAYAVSDLADVNGDGIDDVIALSFSNGSYVVFGRDLDGDHAPRATDNCTFVTNADQRDTDGDGLGNACDPDLTNDCVVNFEDLGGLKTVFFTNDPNGDFDGDGNVNFVDLGVMKEYFFLQPGPGAEPNACAGP